MIIGDIKMIRTITDKMTGMIKDKMLITGFFLRKMLTTPDNHITVIVISIKENIIGTEVFISVTISQKDHDNFNTTTVREVVNICRIRLQRNISKQRITVQVPNCYMCRQDGHYAYQCPTKDKGRAPMVYMVSPEIQQVTTRSKTKQSEWEVQEAVRKAVKEWLEEANKNNASRML